MDGGQQTKGFVLAEYLRERREHQIRGAGRIGVAEHDFAFVRGQSQVFPAFGHGHFSLVRKLGDVA